MVTYDDPFLVFSRQSAALVKQQEKREKSKRWETDKRESGQDHRDTALLTIAMRSEREFPQEPGLRGILHKHIL